eukprot:5714626-Pyramimonas_sp.AAC.1
MDECNVTDTYGTTHMNDKAYNFSSGVIVTPAKPPQRKDRERPQGVKAQSVWGVAPPKVTFTTQDEEKPDDEAPPDPPPAPPAAAAE